jgi:hypothetical protein
MSKLRESARGQPCLVRIQTICNHDASTTVLAHVRMSGISGIGLKSPDLFAAFACSTCHDEIDSRTIRATITETELRVAHLEGMIRTQKYWLDEGYVTVKGEK